MNRLVAVAVLAVALLAAACVNTGEIEGHKIRATDATTITQTAVTHTGIHADAPQWFKDYWVEYLGLVQGGYGTMAVDRKLRGVAAGYCRSSGRCQQLISRQYQSWKDVNYKHRALKACRENVRENYPAAKPACAIYAIRDKIVWKGPLPWE